MPQLQKKAPDIVSTDVLVVENHPNVQEKDQFLYAVTHDMKAGLRALTELPIWVQEDLSDLDITLPDAVRDHLDLMQRNARDLSTMMDRLSDLSRAATTPDTSRRTTVQQAARRAWADIQDKARFKLETHEALDTIYLPERAISDLFRAVLENAVHHHDAASGHVIIASETMGDRVHITVEDDGAGIPSDARERVFDPLVTLAPKEETGRAGLGLNIARKIIAKFGGRISLTVATNGRGLAVLFDVPVRARW